MKSSDYYFSGALLWIAKQSVFTLFITSCCLSLVFGQDNHTKSEAFNSFSPGSYASSKVNNIPMNHFTGQMNLSLPLYSKKLSVLSFGISLSYIGGGGLIADDPGSSVGRGWILNCGGIIVRNKRGVPDDFKNSVDERGNISNKANGILFNGGIADKSDGEGRIDKNDPVFQYTSGYYDSQHDIFDFNIPGHSGKFYIGKNQQIIVVPQSKIKISADFTNSAVPSSQIGSFTIIDEMGIKYHFGKCEYSRDYLSSADYIDLSTYFGKQYASAWFLTRIESVNAEDHIVLNYYDTPEVHRTSFYKVDHHVSKASNSGETISSVHNQIHQSLSPTIVSVKDVTFSDGTSVQFDYFEKTLDYFPILRDMRVLSPNQVETKKVALNYFKWTDNVKAYSVTQTGWAQGVTNPPDYNKIERFYLEDISEISSDGTPQQQYGFTYFVGQEYDETLLRGSMDYWGFHNGKPSSGKSLVPVYPETESADRTSNLHYTKYGVLKEIFYPTGGSEAFDYELNDKRSNNQTIVLGGLRLKTRILREGQNTHTKEYKYQEVGGQSSGFLGDQPIFSKRFNVYSDNGGWPSNPDIKYWIDEAYSTPVNPLSSIGGSPVGYRRVEEILLDGTSTSGKTVYEFTDMNFVDQNLWAPQDYYPYRPVDRPYWALGLPQKISIFDAANNILSQTINDYNIVQFSSADPNFKSLYTAVTAKVDVNVYTSPQPGLIDKIYKYKNYYPLIGRAELIKTEEYKPLSGQMVLSAKRSYAYDPNYYSLRKLTETNYKGENVYTVTHYPYDYTLGVGAATTKMVSDNVLNVPISKENWILKSDGDYLLKSEVTEYTYVNGILRPVKIYNSRIAAPFKPSTTSIFNQNQLVQAERNMTEVMHFKSYSASGKLLQSNAEGAVKMSYIVDKYGKAIAVASNAEYTEVSYASFEINESLDNWSYNPGNVINDGFTGTKAYSGSITKSNLPQKSYQISLWAKGSGSIVVNGISKNITTIWRQYQWELLNTTSVSIEAGTNKIDELRITPFKSLLKSYSFDSYFNLQAETDERGFPKFYTYDNFHRLKNILDHNKDIVKNFAYHFKKPYQSISRSTTTTVYSCPYGQTGGPVNYVVNAGKYTSIISQQDADDKSFYDVSSSNPSVYASAHPNCIVEYQSAAISGSFTKACGTSYYSKPFTVSLHQGAKRSTISQADADAKAQDELNRIGMADADTMGQCIPYVAVHLFNYTTGHFKISFANDIGFFEYNVAPGNFDILVPQGTNYNVYIEPASGTSGMFSYQMDSEAAQENTRHATFTISNLTGAEFTIQSN